MLNSVFIQRAKAAVKRFVFAGRIPLYWAGGRNWGDALSPHIVQYVSGKRARFESAPYVRKYLAIGSVIHFADAWTTIWGSGLISPKHLPRETPLRIEAVRGPKTRDVLLAAGLSCPDVYGDPALLLPRFLCGQSSKLHPVGIVPHYTDRSHPWVIACRDAGYFVIDIESGIEEFVQQVTSCSAVISSSLHGLICADSYGIASRRILLGDEIVGGDFKFQDYYESIRSPVELPLRPKEVLLQDLGQYCSRKLLDIDLDRLLANCPFGSKFGSEPL